MKKFYRHSTRQNGCRRTAKLCDDLREYKKNMLFRFTIGSMNNEILSFWDQYAPLYEERKQSLEFAFNAGYRTSVSVEPMLDSECIEELAHTTANSF